MEKACIQFKIITPEQEVFNEEIKEVTLPTLSGEITVLPKHESLIGVITPGKISMLKKSGGKRHELKISDGFFEIDKDVLRVFADRTESV